MFAADAPELDFLSPFALKSPGVLQLKETPDEESLEEFGDVGGRQATL